MTATLRNSFTAVIEQSNEYDDDFATEPYEAGWALEARWFVRVLELGGDGARLELHPEISPDGLFWCAEGTAPLVIQAPGLYSVPLSGFGHWLRLRGAFAGLGDRAKVLVYLSLKG